LQPQPAASKAVVYRKREARSGGVKYDSHNDGWGLISVPFLDLNGATQSFTLIGNKNTLNLTVSSVIQNGGLINVNSGGSTAFPFLVLSGANTYSGPTINTSGTLTLSNSLALQNSLLDTTSSIAGSATQGIRTTVTNLTLGGLTGNKNFAATGGVFITTTGGYGSVTALTLNPGVGAIPSYAGVIADGAAGMTLTKTGAGTQILSGANTYTGGTTVSQGTLIAAGASALGINSGLTVAGGATFAYRPTAAGALARGTGILTFNGGATIGAALGGTAGQSAITSSGAAVATSGTVTVDICGIPGVATTAGTVTIDVANNGSGSGNQLTLGSELNRRLSTSTAGTLAVTGANGYSLSLPAVNLTGGNSLTLSPSVNLSIGTLTATTGVTVYGAANNITLTLGGVLGTDNSITSITETSGAAQQLIIAKNTAATWTLGNVNVRDGNVHTVSAGILKLNGTFQWTSTNTDRKLTVSGGELHYNNPGAMKTVNGNLIMTGGSLDNSSGAAITTSTHNPQMQWGGNWTFIGSNGAASDNTSSGITVNGPTAAFMQNSSVANSRTFTLTQGTLGGMGTISTAVTSGLGVTIAPGDRTLTTPAAGTLTVTNAVDLSFGTTAMRLFDAGAADKLVQSTAGTINFGGTLSVTQSGSWTWAAATYDLFDWSASSGAFTSVSLPDLTGSGFQWHDYGGGVLFDYTTGSIQVESAALPATAWSNGTGNKKWNDAGNWSSGIPNASGANAQFAIIAGEVTVDANVTVGKMEFTTSNNYGISGTNGITMQTPTGSALIDLQVSGTTHAITAPLTIASSTTIAGPSVGTASLTAGDISTSAGKTLTIGAGGSVTIRAVPVASGGAGGAQAVPEPGTWALIGVGLLSLLALRRRR